MGRSIISGRKSLPLGGPVAPSFTEKLAGPNLSVGPPASPTSLSSSLNFGSGFLFLGERSEAGVGDGAWGGVLISESQTGSREQAAQQLLRQREALGMEASSLSLLSSSTWRLQK